MLDFRRYGLNDYQSHIYYYHSEIHDQLLEWLASIPLSRPVYDIGEDFADGILAADLIYHFFPQLVDLNKVHVPRNMAQRTANWHYLTTEVLSKLGLFVPNMIVVDITNGVHRAVEVFLLQLRAAIHQYVIQHRPISYSPVDKKPIFTGGYQQLPQIITASSRHPVNSSMVTDISKNSSKSGIIRNYATGSKSFNLTTTKGANGSNGSSSVHGSSPTNIKNHNASILKSVNGQNNYLDPSLSPCKEALRLKDKEIGELRERVKTCERMLVDKTKQFEQRLRIKDNRIRHLELQIEKQKVK